MIKNGSKTGFLDFLGKSQHGTSQVFSGENRKPLRERHCINLKGAIMVESHQSVSNIKMSILLMKG